MRIVILGYYEIINKFGGGAGRHIFNLVNNLGNYKDLDLHIISISKNKSSTIKFDGFRLHQIKSPSLPMTITAVSIDAYRIIKLVKKLNPDILHGQMLGAPYGLATALLSKKYKTILTVHSIISDDARYRTHSFKSQIHDLIWKRLENYEIKIIPNFIAISRYIQNELKKRSNDKKNIFYIPNGIDSKWFTNYNEINGRILFVGRILPVKGIEHLIYAAKNIYNYNKNLELHVIGPIDNKYYFNNIKELVRELRLETIVKFMGQMKDEQLLKEYGECAIFVLPSKIETQGIVLLEAMAAGRPVIGFNVGGIPEMIKNGENGFLITYGDINVLAEKMIELLTNKKLRDEMGEKGRKNARDFSWGEITKETYKSYYQLYQLD